MNRDLKNLVKDMLNAKHEITENDVEFWYNEMQKVLADQIAPLRKSFSKPSQEEAIAVYNQALYDVANDLDIMHKYNLYESQKEDKSSRGIFSGLVCVNCGKSPSHHKDKRCVCPEGKCIGGYNCKHK